MCSCGTHAHHVVEVIAAREIWIGDFDHFYRRRENGVWILTCHPFVVGRGHRIAMLSAMLEKVIDHIHTSEGVWWARCIDVAQAFGP